MVTNYRLNPHLRILGKARLNFAGLFGLSNNTPDPASTMFTLTQADLFSSIVPTPQNECSTPAGDLFSQLVVKITTLTALALVQTGTYDDRSARPLQTGSSQFISSYRIPQGDSIGQCEKFDLLPSQRVALVPTNNTFNAVNGGDPDDDEDDLDEDEDLVEEDGSNGDEPDDEDDLDDEDKNDVPAVEVDENDDDLGSDEDFEGEEAIPEPDKEEDDDNDDEDDDDEDDYESDWDEDDDDDEDDFGDDEDLKGLNSYSPVDSTPDSRTLPSEIQSTSPSNTTAYQAEQGRGYLEFDLT